MGLWHAQNCHAADCLTFSLPTIEAAIKTTKTSREEINSTEIGAELGLLKSKHNFGSTFLEAEFGRSHCKFIVSITDDFVASNPLDDFQEQISRVIDDGKPRIEPCPSSDPDPHWELPRDGYVRDSNRCAFIWSPKGRFEGLNSGGDFVVGIVEPVGIPDSVEHTTAAFEELLSEAVSFSGGTIVAHGDQRWAGDEGIS